MALLLFSATTSVGFRNPAQYGPRPSPFITRDPSGFADHRIITTRIFAMSLPQAILNLITFGSTFHRRRDPPSNFFPVSRMDQLNPVVSAEDLCAWDVIGTDGVSTHLFKLIAL